jgi:hypothetical protein
LVGRSHEDRGLMRFHALAAVSGAVLVEMAVQTVAALFGRA